MAVVADALVSKVLDMLLSTISSQIEQEARLIFGVKKQVKSLTSNLQSIQAVLVDAEKRQLQEVTVQLWLDRLKVVSYDIDDVLDEWSFAIMRSQIKGEKYAKKPIIRKVRSFILCSFHEVVFRHHIAVKITELNERLDVIANEKDKYGFRLLKGDNEQVERPITTSFVDISEVKGREVDKEKLVNFLLAESSETPKLHLVSIVGMGGIGKTTLAKLVYNDEMVKTRFEKRIWVCVSDPFDEIRIAKAILESSQGSTPNQVELQNIVEKIQESSGGKKFLVVLDDVSNEDPKKWKQLEDCLKCGLPGSKILVTTRKENVATIMGCTQSDIFRIGLLSKEEFWSIFCDIAFLGKSSLEREGLEDIGKELVGKCKGLPLAVKTIGGLLRFKRTQNEWQSVLDSEFWELEEVERDILAPLWLSYYDLPSPLKQCFSYCATYPKDYRIEKDQLIEQWMAQDYLKETQTKDKETIGDYYFQSLFMRSLFQDFEVEDLLDGKTIYCKMHDMVHDFAASLVKKEHCFTMEFGQRNPFPSSFKNLENLRSFSVQSSPMIRVSLPKIFSELTCLRSLNLSGCGVVEIPSKISKLIHLRLLNLSHNAKLKNLPEKVCRLYNLQTLNVDWCQDLQKLPKGIGELVNLRHVHNFQSLFLLPKRIGSLSGLRRLDRVNIDLNNKEAFSLKDLKNLNHISGSLDIRWLNSSSYDVEDAKQAHLKEKKYIIGLGLLFPFLSTEYQPRQERYEELLEALFEESPTFSEPQDKLVEALQPPPSLELLRIHNYMGKKSPSWINSLTYLRKLQLMNWSNCKYFPPLGKLPCLEFLDLTFFDRVKEAGVEFLGMDESMLVSSSSSSNVSLFPKLTTLSFISMYEWEEWNNYAGDEEIMPCLRSLTLLECEKLKALPNFILKKTPVLQLSIAQCYHLKV
ncbi:putative disease resistance protein RGA3 [Euphorbia lathyris]|uniref:putative disease resistance protein RGA3 n=1 Tax=Euphorbia lathyris TaxID=212925 RepID=UPI003313739B